MSTHWQPFAAAAATGPHANGAAAVHAWTYESSARRRIRLVVKMGPSDVSSEAASRRHRRDSEDSTFITIRETPPANRELETMLNAYDGNLRRLFNVSGGDYRALGLKDTLPSMSKKDAFDLLRSNGNLVKRPFLIGEDVALVGFKESEWVDALES